MNTMTSLGDRHFGKSTCLIREDDGREYIYKPRSAQTERAWSRFLSRLSAAGLVLLPKCADILTENGDEHTETVVQHRETDEEGLQRYWRRSGALLFLSYLLGSTDLHSKNMIADGEFPFVIDLQTLMGGIVHDTDTEQTLLETVMQSHLLPHFSDMQDCGGLTGTDGQNLPMCNGKKAAPFLYLTEVLDGFKAAYRFALPRRQWLADELSVFAGCRFRALLRPTGLYFKMLHNLKLTPEDEREALADSYLRRAYTHGADSTLSDEDAKMLQAEKDALLAGDIPLFYGEADGLALMCGDKTLKKVFFRLSALDAAKRRALALNETDLQKQLALISLAFSATAPLPAPSVEPAADWMERIGTVLATSELPTHKSVYVRLMSRGSHTALRSAGFGSYYGLSGVLCCYAAFYARTKDSRWTDCIARHLTQLEEKMIEPTYPLYLNDTTCCLYTGIGGTVAALLHVWELTGDSRAYDDAVALAKKFVPSALGRCTADVLSGAAGLCLSLPKLPREISVPLAEALFPILMNAESTLTGAAHGAAGHALALGALQSVLQTDAADEKILSLLQWEDAQYSEETHNWKDLREHGQVSYMRGWCSGAPGIGMYRKKLCAYTKNEAILALCRDDMQRASDLLLPPLPYASATLCCGEAARVMAASCLGIRVWQQLSRIVRADAPELFHPMQTADVNVSLMQGLAGIGYALAMEGDDRSGGMLL